MPITADNYQRAEDFIARAQMDPTFDPARLAKLKTDLETFKTTQSQSVPYRDGENPSGPAMRGSVAGYFYEPSVDEFHNALKDRTTREQLGLGDTYREDNSAGRSYLESQVPELAKLQQTDINQLGEHSPEYQAYSNYAYQKAKDKNPNLERYSDLEVTKNPFKKALGAVVKYGPAAALGAEKTLTLGSGRGAIAQAMVSEPAEPGSRAAAVGRPKQSASQAAADESVKQKTIQSAKDLESLSPAANTIGQLGAYTVPVAPANAAARGLVDVTGYAARSPLVKALIGGGIGSTVAAGEGALQDVFGNPNITGQELTDNATSRAIYGGALGTAGDLLAQGATKAKTAFEESPRWSPIKNQKDIGGNTNLFTGIETTPKVRGNVRTANIGRENRTAADIAAQKVAPQIRESLDNQLTKKVTEIGNQVEDYTKSPYGLEEQSASPAVDRLLAMAEKGTVSMPVSGRVVSANRGAADAVRKNLQEFADFAHVTPEEAQAMAQQHGGKILSTKQADILGLPQEAGKVHVVVPGKFNAEALLKKEDQIARNLKYDTKEGGVDNPVLQELNLAFKEIRDKFKYDDPAAVAHTELQTSNIDEPYHSSIAATPTAAQPESTVPSSIASQRTEAAPVNGGNQAAPSSPIRREPSFSEYYTPDINGGFNRKNPEGPWKSMDPEVNQYLGELGYGEHVNNAKSNDYNRYKLNNEFSEYVTPEVDVSKPQPKNGRFDDLTPSEYEGFKNRYDADVDRTEEAYKAMQEKKATVQPPAFTSEEATKRNETPTVPPKSPKQVPVYEQRKLELEKNLPDGNFTKNHAADKMGWKHVPEWEVDQLVKEGKLEQVPPEEKQFSQVDAEYRKPKKQATVTPEPKPKTEAVAESAVEDLPMDEVHSLHPSRFGQPNPTADKSSAGAESGIDAKLLERAISDQAKLDGVPDPLRTPVAQLTAKLDDGTTVHGFSALRRLQHQALQKLEDAKKGTGAATQEGAHRRVLNYKHGEGSPYENAALAEEADKLGIRQQLEEVPATREYPGLRARAWGGGGEGPMNSLKDFMGFRLDPVLSALAGEGRNPYSPMPNTPAGRIRQYLFQQGVPMRPLLETRGGLAGARYGNEVSDYQEAKKRNVY